MDDQSVFYAPTYAGTHKKTAQYDSLLIQLLAIPTKGGEGGKTA
uniref:Uncharacterized protein n=1 Tax=Coprothermobacter proteolyticus (strain ATCC 35245 / DSM 5265 / OCM 4 / BT) TaxID=309798 RepID=B5Y7L7_COPPD